MKKLLAAAALATVALSGSAQAGGYGHSYGHSYGYAPSYSTYVEVPVYRYRPRYVKRYVVKRHYVPSYSAPSYSYHGGY